MLTCQICRYVHQTMISPSHLKTHGITGEEYKRLYPGFKLRVQTEESRAKASQTKKGSEPWNKGVKTGKNEALSEAIKGKSRPGSRGKKRSPEQCRRISEATRAAMAGGLSEETKEKLKRSISERKANGTYIAAFSGHRHTEESRKKIAIAGTGENNWTRKALNLKLEEICGLENLTLLSRQRSSATGSSLTFKCNTCSTTFSFGLGYFTESQRMAGHAVSQKICPACHPRIKSKSAKEIELLEFIKSVYDGEIKSGNRTVLFPLELDVFLPQMQLAIEFNGLYWHSENISRKSGVNKYRDYEKYLLCKEQGIALISIFEDEWDNKQEIVKSRLRQILKIKGDRYRVHARQCVIKQISKVQKDEFLQRFHIQKSDRSSTLLGAFFNQELVAVMTFMPTTFVKGGDGSQTELSRFAIHDNYVIPGIASKLLSAYRRAHQAETIISYSDNRWSTGNVYKVLGFSLAGSSKPGYFYINMKNSDKTRIHRSNFMKHRLGKILGDGAQQMIDAGRSEWEIMQEHGYDRIWDCGTTKWILYPEAAAAQMPG